MAVWHKHDSDRIASARLAEDQSLRDCLQSLIDVSTLSYSGIVLSGAEKLVSGSTIESACYERGGMLWLHRGYEEAAESIGEFPIQHLLGTLKKASASYASHVLGYRCAEPIIDAAWAVCQRDGDFATVHDHTTHHPIAGKFFSGVYYLQVPSQIRAENFPSGCLYFIDGRSVTYVPPISGCLAIWPAEMLHGAHPFRGPGDRLAVAFNVIIEGE